MSHMMTPRYPLPFCDSMGLLIEGLLEGDKGAQQVWESFKRARYAKRGLTGQEYSDFIRVVERLAITTDNSLVVDLENMSLEGVG